MSLDEEALRREVKKAAANLQGAPEFRTVLEFISFLIQFNIERCITHSDPLVVNRAQGAVQELRDLRLLLAAERDPDHRRGKMRPTV